jgi:hypothetical protein
MFDHQQHLKTYYILHKYKIHTHNQFETNTGGDIQDEILKAHVHMTNKL